MWLATRMGEISQVPFCMLISILWQAPPSCNGLWVNTSTFPHISGEDTFMGHISYFSCCLSVQEKKKLVKTSFQLCLYKRKKESLNVEIIILHRTCRSFRGYYFDRCLFLGNFQANPPPWICCLLLSCPFLRCVNKQWRGRKQIFCQGNAGPFGNTCLKRHILNR